MIDIRKRLFEMGESEYAAFQAKLTPGIENEKFIGIRVPTIRKFAKECYKDEAAKQFINQLPHEFFDEYMLHVLLVSEDKDFDRCIEETEKILPYIDNWAVCDIFSPKCFAKNKEALLVKIKEWIKSDKTYTIRFGIEMLMKYYLDDDFKAEYLELPASVHSEEYYVNMMIAWYFATALAKQWDSTIGYIEKGILEKWTHNKTIQKSIESYRITDEQKTYLRTLKKK